MNGDFIVVIFDLKFLKPKSLDLNLVLTNRFIKGIRKNKNKKMILKSLN